MSDFVGAVLDMVLELLVSIVGRIGSGTMTDIVLWIDVDNTSRGQC
jgi:hypothetical protein